MIPTISLRPENIYLWQNPLYETLFLFPAIFFLHFSYAKDFFLRQSLNNTLTRTCSRNYERTSAAVAPLQIDCNTQKVIQLEGQKKVHSSILYDLVYKRCPEPALRLVTHMLALPFLIFFSVSVLSYHFKVKSLFFVQC